MPIDAESNVPDATEIVAPEDVEIVEGEAGDEPESSSGPVGKGSSNLVYAALGAGLAVLALLLLIVWLSSRDDESGNVPLCLDISSDRATDAVLAGDVEQVDVLLDQQDPLDGLTAVQLQMTDGECRRLPEGADNRDGLYQILGAVELYNEAGEQRIAVHYQRQDVPSSLLYTSTPEPSETAIVSPTAERTPSPEPTATAIPATPLPPTPAASPQPAKTIPASPAETAVASSSPVAIGSPAASPSAASPVSSPSPGPSPTGTP